MSDLNSDICRLSIIALKKGQRRYISCSSRCLARPPASQLSMAWPTPYQAGIVVRDMLQPNTHGIARTDDLDRSPLRRCDGREPMFIRPISATGVAWYQVVDPAIADCVGQLGRRLRRLQFNVQQAGEGGQLIDAAGAHLAK